MHLITKLFLIFIALIFGLSAKAQTYTEQYRMQYHFSPERNWVNDPCGMVYLNGTYHLMYQYNPHGTQWGNMSWGHATSTDLMHWKEQGVVLYNDSQGAIFSGGAVIDYHNTSGFGDSAMVAIYTSAGQTQKQSLAYSLDQGINWTKYSGNPVLPNKGIIDFRDPTVLWHESTHTWVMTLAEQDQIGFYSSPNLKDWTYQSAFGKGMGAHGGVWECPGLFQLEVQGTSRKLWVLMVSINPGSPSGGSGTQYFVGDFDGKSFTLTPEFELLLNPQPTDEVLVFEDFESGYENWTVTGTAFGQAPVAGTLPDQQLVTNFQGDQLVNSYLNGDSATGSLTSAPFIIESNYINFLIGGGHHPDLTAIKLIVDDQVVRSATGSNTEQLRWYAWDVSEYAGKSAQLKIVDEVTGGWGHINVDHVYFSDQAIVQKEAFWVNHGPDDYAGRSFQQTPDGRVLWMSWMNNWSYAGNLPTSTWRGGMSLPRELTLKETPAGIRLFQQPAAEVYELRQDTLVIQGDLDALNTALVGRAQSSNQYELRFSINQTNTQSGAGVILAAEGSYYTQIGYDPKTAKVFLDRKHSGVAFSGDYTQLFDFSTSELQSLNFQIFVDQSSVEVFVNDGEELISARIFPSSGATGLSFYGDVGSITEVSHFEYGNIWREAEALVTFTPKSRVKIFPNPSQGKFRVEGVKSLAHVELIGMSGNRLPFTISTKNEGYEIVLDNETYSGVIILRIVADNQIITEQLINQ